MILFGTGRFLNGDLRCPGPMSALINPAAQQTDLRAREPLAFLRHELAWFEFGDEVDQPALGAVAGDKSRPVLAAFQGQVPDVPTQFSFLFVFAVAHIAVPGEDGLNVFDEIDFTVGRRRQFREIKFGGGGAGIERTAAAAQSNPPAGLSQEPSALRQVRMANSIMIQATRMAAFHRPSDFCVWASGWEN